MRVLRHACDSAWENLREQIPYTFRMIKHSSLFLLQSLINRFRIDADHVTKPYSLVIAALSDGVRDVSAWLTLLGILVALLLIRSWTDVGVSVRFQHFSHFMRASAQQNKEDERESLLACIMHGKFVRLWREKDHRMKSLKKWKQTRYVQHRAEQPWRNRCFGSGW